MLYLKEVIFYYGLNTARKGVSRFKSEIVSCGISVHVYSAQRRFSVTLALTSILSESGSSVRNYRTGMHRAIGKVKRIILKLPGSLLVF